MVVVVGGWVSVQVLSDLAALACPTSVPHVCAMGHNPCLTVRQETEQNSRSAPQLKELAQERACLGSS